MIGAIQNSEYTFFGKISKNKHFKYAPNFFPQFFSLANFFQIPGSGSKLGNTLILGKKKKKKKKKNLQLCKLVHVGLVFFQKWCHHVPQGARSVKISTFQKKKVAYRAPAAQLKYER